MLPLFTVGERFLVFGYPNILHERGTLQERSGAAKYRIRDNVSEHKSGGCEGAHDKGEGGRGVGRNGRRLDDCAAALPQYLHLAKFDTI